MLNPKIDKIAKSLTEWTKSETNENFYFRIANHKRLITLFRKEIHPAYFGGYKIIYIHLTSKLAEEWINENFN